MTPLCRLRRVPLRLACLFAACCICMVGNHAVAAPLPPTVRLIAASATDQAVSDVIGVHHIAIGEEEVRMGRLFVFLPGTLASPQDYALLIERAARLGYHAIGLSYVNTLPVSGICLGLGATECHETARRARLPDSAATSRADHRYTLCDSWGFASEYNSVLRGSFTRACGEGERSPSDAIDLAHDAHCVAGSS